jgi:NTP pyrophosphatase (non-canonical NTP hydrolase)
MLKHGLPDKKALAKEVQDVIRTALSIARYYDVEQELKDSIDQSYRTKSTKDISLIHCSSSILTPSSQGDG